MKFQPLDTNSVVSFSSAAMFKVEEFITKTIKTLISKGYKQLSDELSSSGKGQLPPNNEHYFFHDGISCEILIPTDANGWQKGKVRMKVILEFCPDRPPVEQQAPKVPIAYEEVLEHPEESEASPLDDIRRRINNSN
jgi:hypothetical protein